MSFLTWNPEYELGIPEMDAQHKRWLELLNGFYDELESQSVDHTVKKLVEEALEYTKYHFAQEETLMASIGYPAIDEQKGMHRNIARRMLEFKERIDAGRHVISMPITAELKSWFREHILVEDKKYARLYLSKRSQ